MRLLLLSALLATLSRLTGLLRWLLVLLTERLLATTTLLTTALAALLVLLVLIFIVLAHSILQMFLDLLFECHHSSNPLYVSHIAARARDAKKEI
jgi:hypothetical protein